MEGENMTIESLLEQQKKIQASLEQMLNFAAECGEDEKSCMQKDFWLYELSNVMEKSKLDLHQRTRLLQLLLDMFRIRHPLWASEYFEKMSHDNLYYKYMAGCYGVAFDDRSVFWDLLYQACINDDDWKYIFDEFSKAHGELVIGLEEYLTKMFPSAGFGEWTSRYMIEHMIQITQLEKEMRDGESAINIWRNYCKAAYEAGNPFGGQ